MQSANNINIKEATISDFEYILKLNKNLFEFDRKFSSEYNLDWTYSEKGTDYFKKRLENPNTIALIAEVDNNPVGYLLAFADTYSFRKNNPIVEIENMFVVEKYRNQGIGSKLIETLKEIAKQRGVKRIKVGALAKNTTALAFYKQTGFEDFELILEFEIKPSK